MRLLVADDPAPAVVEFPGGSSPFLLVGDHAGRCIPTRLNDLGLEPADLDRHIAYDIGVRGLGRALARALDATFVRQRYSRLVIDCNRDPDRPDAIVGVSDRTPIPGNAALSADDASARRREIFDPYHGRIAELLDARAARGLPTTFVALHSFTPALQGETRPWLYGVLHLNDSPFAHALLGGLRDRFGQAAGDNEPYQMDGTDYTVPAHAIARGLAYAEIEVRQDLIETEAGQAQTAAVLAALLPEALAKIGG